MPYRVILDHTTTGHNLYMFYSTCSIIWMQMIQYSDIFHVFSWLPTQERRPNDFNNASNETLNIFQWTHVTTDYIIVCYIWHRGIYTTQALRNALCRHFSSIVSAEPTVCFTKVPEMSLYFFNGVFNVISLILSNHHTLGMVTDGRAVGMCTNVYPMTGS